MEFKETKKLGYESGVGLYEVETSEGSTIYVVKMGRGKPLAEQIGTSCHNWKAEERAGAEWFYKFQIERKNK